MRARFSLIAALCACLLLLIVGTLPRHVPQPGRPGNDLDIAAADGGQTRRQSRVGRPDAQRPSAPPHPIPPLRTRAGPVESEPVPPPAPPAIAYRYLTQEQRQEHHQTLKAEMDPQYGEFFRMLQLSAAEEEQLKDLIAARHIAMQEGTPEHPDRALIDFLGEENFQALTDYSASLESRAFFRMFLAQVNIDLFSQHGCCQRVHSKAGKINIAVNVILRQLGELA